MNCRMLRGKHLMLLTTRQAVSTGFPSPPFFAAHSIRCFNRIQRPQEPSLLHESTVKRKIFNTNGTSLIHKHTLKARRVMPTQSSSNRPSECVSLLSHRGRRALQPLASYFQMFSDAKKHVFREKSQSDGYVVMSVAENNLSTPMVDHRLRLLQSEANVLEQNGGVSNSDPKKYDDWGGRATLRHAFQTFAETFITRGAPVDSTCLHISSGCGSLIEHLAFLLMDEATDCVLLPTPAYGALWNDFCVRANVRLVEVPMNLSRCGGDGVITVEALDEAAARAVRCGLNPKMLFIMNPQNPLGILYTENDLRTMMNWSAQWTHPKPNTVEAHNGPSMHCVVDEIYALSNHSRAAEEMFVSAATIAARAKSPTENVAITLPLSYLGPRTHLLWGFSKDFCLGGARAGVLFTHNREVLQALSNTGYFTATCNLTQDLLAKLISDAVWIRAFIDHQQQVLSSATTFIFAALSKAGIPFVRAVSGIFVWIDLSRCLPTNSVETLHGSGSTHHRDDDLGWQRERELTNQLFHEARILLTPGESQHHNALGWYRCCFAWPGEAGLKEGIRRLIAFYAKRCSSAGTPIDTASSSRL